MNHDDAYQLKKEQEIMPEKTMRTLHVPLYTEALSSLEYDLGRFTAHNIFHLIEMVIQDRVERQLRDKEISS